MFRLIKWLIVLAIIGAIVLWITGWKIQGKTLQEHLKPYLESPMVKEGIHDVRSIVGEGLKAAGEAVSEDVTPDERKQLDDLVKKELLEGKPVQLAPGQQALPPQPQVQAVPPTPATGRPTVEQLQAMPQPPAPPGAPPGLPMQAPTPAPAQPGY